MTRVICNLRETCEVTARILGADMLRDNSRCRHAQAHYPGHDCQRVCNAHGTRVIPDLPAHCEECND